MQIARVNVQIAREAQMSWWRIHEVRFLQPTMYFL